MGIVNQKVIVIVKMKEKDVGGVGGEDVLVLEDVPALVDVVSVVVTSTMTMLGGLRTQRRPSCTPSGLSLVWQWPLQPRPSASCSCF